MNQTLILPSRLACVSSTPTRNLRARERARSHALHHSSRLFMQSDAVQLKRSSSPRRIAEKLPRECKSALFTASAAQAFVTIAALTNIASGNEAERSFLQWRSRLVQTLRISYSTAPQSGALTCRGLDAAEKSSPTSDGGRASKGKQAQQQQLQNGPFPTLHVRMYSCI